MVFLIHTGGIVVLLLRRVGDFVPSPSCPDWMWVLGAHCLGVKQLGLDSDHL